MTTMLKRDFIEIINEELSNFDFLGNEEFLKEQEVTDLLQNEDLQKQFICDALLDKKDKVRTTEVADSYISGNWDETNTEDADRVSLQYSLNMAYKYDTEKEPINFNLSFNADKVDISVGGWYDPGRWGGTMADAIEPSGESWYDVFDWSDIEVSLTTIDEGDEVPFTAFEKAPPRIQTLFIRHFVESFVESQSLEMKTDDIKDKVENTPYC